MTNQQAGAGGTWRMIAAMAMSGTIGWFVVTSGQPTIDVVFSAACSAVPRCWAC
ncbi:hypothetical protein ACTMU2_06750 [Cupriavidus basilensis]